jgi:hypothetical protein
MNRQLYQGDVWRHKSGAGFEQFKVIRACWAQTLVRGTDFVDGRIQPAGIRMLDGNWAPPDWTLLRRETDQSADHSVVPLASACLR